jgi:AcrR family transcriptional regulator
MNYIAERRQEEKERRRADFLDAAESVLTSVGWDELTMDQVARGARLSRALLYVYFQDKVDLMYGICERALLALGQRMEEAVSRHKAGLDQMVAIGRAYIAFSQEFPGYFDILARCELRVVSLEWAPNEAACMQAGNRVQALMESVVQSGVHDGSIRADVGEPKLVAVTLWGLMHGVIQLAAAKAKLLAYHGVDRQALLDQALLMARRSLASTP